VILPTRLTNEMDGETYGAEVAVNWNVNPRLRVQASYTWLEAQLHRGRNDIPTLEQTFEGSSPHNQAQLHVYYDIMRNLEVNTSVYYVDHLKALDIPAYVRWDLAVTWRPDDRLELSAGVRNLLDDRHPEWNNGLIHEQSTETPRTVYAEATWRY
jgi:iron complex outermembrane receptor protein